MPLSARFDLLSAGPVSFAVRSELTFAHRSRIVVAGLRVPAPPRRGRAPAPSRGSKGMGHFQAEDGRTTTSRRTQQDRADSPKDNHELPLLFYCDPGRPDVRHSTVLASMK